jgi:hypothetical protein
MMWRKKWKTNTDLGKSVGKVGGCPWSSEEVWSLA